MEKKRAWYQEPMIWLVIAIPAAAILWGMFMLYISIVTSDGLVDDDYYKQGKEINRVIARDQVAARLGLSGSVTLQQKAIAVSLDSSRGHKLPDAVQLKFLHATRGGADHILIMPAVSNGRYEIPLPKLAAGSYNLQVSAEQWRLIGRINADTSTQANLKPAI